MTEWIMLREHKYCGNCAKLPVCLNCRLPCSGKRLADGRHICSKCSEAAIFDEELAETLFRQVREDISKYLNLRTDHPIEFYMKDGMGFIALVGKYSNVECGYYLVQTETQTRRGGKSAISETYAIYILSALSPPFFRNAVAHELAHDIGHTFYPFVRRKEDVEGFAEYISSLMNHYWGNEVLNQGKLQSTFKEYAEGYAKFLKIGKKNGLKGVLDYMEKQNRASRGR